MHFPGLSDMIVPLVHTSIDLLDSSHDLEFKESTFHPSRRDGILGSDLLTASKTAFQCPTGRNYSEIALKETGIQPGQLERTISHLWVVTDVIRSNGAAILSHQP